MPRVLVCEMSQHFLYLPFYYAKENDFFGYLPSGYTVEMEGALPKTDVRALKKMLAKDDEDILRFALCDPSPLLDMQTDEDDPPAVVAAVITNAAIWAVDKDAEPVTCFDELQKFQKIIAFGKGTTTFGMARRLVGASGYHRIETVDPGQELDALLAVKDAVAFSPEILEAVAAIKENQYKIILPLGSTREYDNVLVTALTTRKSVVEIHKPLVLGMLAALQRAIVEVNLQSDAIRQFAAKRFNRSEDLVALALEKAADASVFPANILVQRNHWEAAAQSYCEGLGKPFDADTKMKSYRLYDAFAKRHLPLAKQAMQSVVHGGISKESGSDETFVTGAWIALGLFAGLFASAAVLFVFPALVTAIGLAGVFGACAVATARYRSTHLSRFQLAVHFFAYTVCAVLAFLALKYQTGVFIGAFAAVAPTVIGADYSFVLGGSKR
jgi:ABC-type nitrate/sulfonate/bicarbonate transport system substrate-binding protein